MAGLIGAALGGLAIRHGWTETPGICMVVPALMLVPGPHLINGVYDVLENHVLPGVCRLGLATGILIATATSVGLLSFRVSYTNSPQFTFMTWNLFLAWIPLVLGAGTFALHRIGAPWWSLPLVAIPWLLFLPNAPYLVTDFSHLEWAHSMPRWFDILVLGSFATTGLILGGVSLYLVQLVVRERFGQPAGWGFVASVCVLCGAGIYLGRYLRLNSWDVLSDWRLFVEMAWYRGTDPLGNPALLETVALSAIMVALSYLVVAWMVGAGSRWAARWVSTTSHET